MTPDVIDPFNEMWLDICVLLAKDQTNIMLKSLSTESNKIGQ